MILWVLFGKQDKIMVEEVSTLAQNGIKIA
jgi:hypothetical protein